MSDWSTKYIHAVDVDAKDLSLSFDDFKRGEKYEGHECQFNPCITKCLDQS